MKIKGDVKMHGKTVEMEMQDIAIKENSAKIKHKIVVMSGKGGVGKSTVAANLAYGLALEGKKVGILDADIHGPNIPLMFGVEGQKLGSLSEPMKVHDNLSLVSLSFYVGDSDSPIIWRGPAKLGAIRQFMADVNWGELDYLVVDLPPGTGDEPLAVAQNMGKIDGSIIVTTPQDVALLDSRKSVKFSKLVNMPVYGLVENMSGFICPHCGDRIDIFKNGGGVKAAKELNIDLLAKIPLDAAIVEAGDSGKPFIYFSKGNKAGEEFRNIVQSVIIKSEGGDIKMAKKMKIAVPTNDRTNVEEHFGHCKEFAIYEVEGDKVINVEFIVPPPHAPGVIPNFLNEHGINAIITGGMGQMAVNMFKEKNVDVILGAVGSVDTNLKEYLSGMLESTGSVCAHEHGEGHSCSH